MHRIKNTYNIKAKRFCIPLTKEQFIAGDDIIKFIAIKQHFINNTAIGNKLFNIQKFDHKLEKFDNVINNSNFKSSSNRDYINYCDVFIKNLLMNKELGWNDRFLVILYFKEKGYTREEVFEILKENLSERKFVHCIKEERQLQYLFERDDLMFPEKYCKVYK